ncbi:MAG: hypothetical protein ACRERD_29525 [Candidatus Binatia bacterium]
MVEITIALPEALAERLAAVQGRLPEVLARVLDEPSPLPNEVYRYILEFLASNPPPEAVVDFKPAPVVQERISELLGKNRTGQLTPAESAELDEYERINRLVRKFKLQALKDLKATSQCQPPTRGPYAPKSVIAHRDAASIVICLKR